MVAFEKGVEGKKIYFKLALYKHLNIQWKSVKRRN